MCTCVVCMFSVPVCMCVFICVVRRGFRNVHFSANVSLSLLARLVKFIVFLEFQNDRRMVVMHVFGKVVF